MRSFSLFVARKYLFSTGKITFIHILSLVSLLGVMVGTAAMIIILSVFNGLEKYVQGLFSQFDPDIKVEAVEGKHFELKNRLQTIQSWPEIAVASASLEENILVRYNGHEELARIKGIDDQYSRLLGNIPQMSAAPLNYTQMLIDGSIPSSQTPTPTAMIGQELQRRLGVDFDNFTENLTFFVPRAGLMDALHPEESFNEQSIAPSGMFKVDPDIDAKYILVPIDFAEEYLEQSGKATSIELKLKSKDDEAKVKQKLASLFGKNFTFKNRYEQQESLYQVFRLEKWAGFLILFFIILIATLGLIGSISMLVLDKQKDISVLYSMGATKQRIQRIFFYDGMLITMVGVIGGLILGISVVLIQNFHPFVTLNENGLGYPVDLRIFDIIVILSTVPLVGAVCSYIPSRNAGSVKG